MLKYSDYNVILINIDFISLENVSRKKKMMKRKGFEKNQAITQEK